MSIDRITPEYLKLAEDIFGCRVCRHDSPQFAAETGGPERHPEMAHGSPTPTILIVSLNPRLDPNRVLERDPTSLVRTATDPSSVMEGNTFDQALAKALPDGYSLRAGNVTNTRVYKCATLAATKVKGVAARCADGFLTRELAILKPRVVLAMAKTAWPEVFRVLEAGPPPSGSGPHTATGVIGARRLPVVACWHLTGNVSARSDAYRFAVRKLVSEALAAK